jgi:hypothetical protein
MIKKDCTFPNCDMRVCECSIKNDMWLMRTGRHGSGAVSTIKRLEFENARLQARLEVMSAIIQDYRESK